MPCSSPYSKASNNDSHVVRSLSNSFLSTFLLRSGAQYFSSLQYLQSINPCIFSVRKDLWLSPLQKPRNEDTEVCADLAKASCPGKLMPKARTESGPPESPSCSSFPMIFLYFSLTPLFCLKRGSLVISEIFFEIL